MFCGWRRGLVIETGTRCYSSDFCHAEFGSVGILGLEQTLWHCQQVGTRNKGRHEAVPYCCLRGQFLEAPQGVAGVKTVPGFTGIFANVSRGLPVEWREAVRFRQGSTRPRSAGVFSHRVSS